MSSAANLSAWEIVARQAQTRGRQRAIGPMVRLLVQPHARREASASTGETDVDSAVLALDRRYLNDAEEAPAYCHACGQPPASANAYLLTDAIAD